jgi:hypothetical protein
MEPTAIKVQQLTKKAEDKAKRLRDLGGRLADGSRLVASAK